MTNPYVVHTCEPQGCSEGGCDGTIVFADDEASALALGATYTEQAEYATATHDPRCEPLRSLWEGTPLRCWAPNGDTARLWRNSGWGEQDRCCGECGLPEWDEIPESTLDEEGDYCRECGPETPSNPLEEIQGGINVNSLAFQGGPLELIPERQGR